MPRHYRLTLAAALAGLVSLGSGCVSMAEHAELERKNRELAWTLERSDEAISQKDKDLLRLRQQLGIKDSELNATNERLARAEAALRTARTEIDQAFSDNIKNVAQDLQMEVSPYGGLILENSILFAPGNYVLRPEGKAMLQTVVAKLNSPEYAHTEIEVAGHTDADPIKHAAKKGVKNNWDLSARRAMSVLEGLLALGVPRERVFLSGYAYGRPIAANTTAQGKKRNRRVEIRLHQPGGGSGG